MKPTTLLWCATVVAACANVTTPTTEQETRLAQARSLLSADPDRAIDVAESLLQENANLREARLLAAEGSMRLAQAGKGRADLHLYDAAANFDRALDGVPDADEPMALSLLAECRFQLGEFDAASAAALRAANGFAGVPVPENRRNAAAAWLLAGKCDLQRFVAAREAELKSGTPGRDGKVPFARGTVELASLAVARLQQARRELPADATVQIATAYAWLEQRSEGLRELERGLREAPDETAIHDTYMAWMTDADRYAEMVGAYARFVRENPSTPILRWHQGRALYTWAEALRGPGNRDAAAAQYRKAEGVFGEYAAMVPAHAELANQWRGLCHLSIARMNAEAGHLDQAADELLAAGAVSTAITSYPDGKPQLFDRFGNHFTGCVAEISKALAESGADALPRVLAFNERVLAQYPDRWGFLYNNAALAARDLGGQLAEAGKTAAAKELWERSYRYYEKAVALAPDDARIVNDCAVILIYNLNRELDHARALCDRAVALGKQQLAELPADADPRRRESLEEAVGDALQNTAVLLRDHQHVPFAEFRSFCEEAVKYYPYERREAAAMLRNGGPSEDPAAQQGAAAEALAKRRAAIDAKVQAEDFDGALADLDAIAKDCKDHAPYQALKGDITLKLAAKAMAAKRRGVDLLFQDAVAALQRAVELDGGPAGPRQKLAEAQFQSGNADGAARTLSALLLHLQSQGGGKPDELLALHTLRATTGALSYSQKKSNNEDDKDLLAALRASFRFLEEKGKLLEDLKAKGQVEGSMLSSWATAEAWSGAGAEAVNVYARALAKDPENNQLLGAVVSTAYAQKQMPAAVEALAKRTDATGLWWLGEARFWHADGERNAGRPADALKVLDAAREAFQASLQKNAGFKDSCEQKIAWCLGKKGCIAASGDDLATAEKWLLESAKMRPDRIADDLGSQESTKLGILTLVDKFMKKNDLGKVEAISRAAADAANGDVDLLNNAGLFARDWGNQLERSGKKKEADEMYEQSYKAYRRAQQLDPTNVRLRNDCALIAIYHLDRDWDDTKKLLESAIADGEKTLRDNPPADANDKERLDEAVGDCLENLALWHLKHSKDGAAAKAAAEASMKHFPRERRGGARRHLAEAERLLQGK